MSKENIEEDNFLIQIKSTFKHVRTARQKIKKKMKYSIISLPMLI